MKGRDRAAMPKGRVSAGVRGWGCSLETLC